jgi:broad specificity phosphatase PhoE
MKVYLVRHSESAGNVLAKQAKESGALEINTDIPNPHLPLSAAGKVQASQIDLSKLPVTPQRMPVYCSPYLRARQTMKLAAPYVVSAAIDERLRDRELGCLDGLTLAGIERLRPEEFAIRQRMGKFYHRPAGGESWSDVALRVRAFLHERRTMGSRHLLIFSHDVTILTAIYICNRMTPEEIVDFQKNTPVLNGSVTELEYHG